jgi:hypothetical protein
MGSRARTRGAEGCVYLIVKGGVEEDTAYVSNLTEHLVARMQLGLVTEVARVEVVEVVPLHVKHD